jgi:hypothetical protein
MLLVVLIRKDLAVSQGCAVIDPHGDQIKKLKVAVALVGCWRGVVFLHEQVVLAGQADPYRTVAFNPDNRLPGVS